MDNDSNAPLDAFTNEWFTTLTHEAIIDSEVDLNVDSNQQGLGQYSTMNYEILDDENEMIQVDVDQCEPLLSNLIFKTEQYDIDSHLEQELEPISTTYVPASLPASQDWPGEYGFDISFEKKTKNITWTYSQSKDKLYVCKGASCPVNFSTKFAMPSNVKIRAMLLYSSPESASEVVERCANHLNEDSAKNIQNVDHFVRCESPMAVYEKDAVTNHKSVVVMFENPPAGQSFSTYIYKFTCLGSCPGPNRRPLIAVFTLEKNDQVLGRKILNVKICACPQRDKKSDEEKALAQTGESKKRKRNDRAPLPEVVSLPSTSCASPQKKAKVSPSQDGCYYVKVKDIKCFEFLEQMKKYYEIIKAVKNLPPDVKNAVERYQQRKGYNVNFGI